MLGVVFSSPTAAVCVSAITSLFRTASGGRKPDAHPSPVWDIYISTIGPSLNSIRTQQRRAVSTPFEHISIFVKKNKQQKRKQRRPSTPFPPRKVLTTYQIQTIRTRTGRHPTRVTTRSIVSKEGTMRDEHLWHPPRQTLKQQRKEKKRIRTWPSWAPHLHHGHRVNEITRACDLLSHRGRLPRRYARVGPMSSVHRHALRQPIIQHHILHPRIFGVKSTA